MATSASTAASCRPAGLVSAAASRAIAQIVAPVPRVSTSHAATMTSAHSASLTASGVDRRGDEGEHRRQQDERQHVAATSPGIGAPAGPDQRPQHRDQRAGGQPVDERRVPRIQAGAADDRLGERVHAPVVDLRVGRDAALVGRQRRPCGGSHGVARRRSTSPGASAFNGRKNSLSSVAGVSQASGLTRARSGTKRSDTAFSHGCSHTELAFIRCCGSSGLCSGGRISAQPAR